MIITFDEQKHQYTNETGESIPSVTQILGKVYGTGLENAPEYFVNRAAAKGTKIHKEIETYLNGGKEGETPEFKCWLKEMRLLGYSNKDTDYECEKIICATTPYGQFAGTLDFFADGIIKDWKTCKTATRKQIDKWQKQLSFYIYALRQMGYQTSDKADIFHLTDICTNITVDYLGDGWVEETMRLYQAGETPKEETQLLTVSVKELQLLEDTLFQIQALEKVAEEYRARIKNEMERRGILNIQIGKVKMTLVPGTVRATFDSTSFKSEHADLYKQYIKNTEVKPSLRITVK